MLKRVSRRVFLGGALGGLASLSWAGAPDVSLRPRARPGGFTESSVPSVEDLIRESRLSGVVTFSVIDVKSGDVLETHDGYTGQPPASVTKAVTALYALDALGPDYRFETRLLAGGEVKDGVLHGDLVLAGGGDPMLDTDQLADMAARLKAAGVREVRGKFRVWGGALPFERVIDPSQPEEVGYNPAISGLNLNYNRVHFEWKLSGGKYTVTMDARSGKYRPDVTVARMQVAARDVPVYTYADMGDHDAWTVARGALGNGGARWLPVRKPEAYAAEVFATFARSHGIKLEMGQPPESAPEGRVLVTHKSETLDEILRLMLLYSNNLTAELCGMTATARRLGKPASMKDSAEEMSRWAQTTLGMPGAKLVDHSGLGETSRLRSAALAQALAKVHKDGLLKPILKDIPMYGSNGQVNVAHPVKVVAKTGTLYFVSSLAGYLTAPDGRELAFAIFTANPELRKGFDKGSGARPEGARTWNARSKDLQQRLLERWGRVYGS
ncbi:D-alanyl-D-alanine carboxypeptidase/D-alanyl-D-alanine endopeptidase [Roseovarius indicus]|uniref:D-alanyl-D-alanine carboxypeptidase/D-alanyl-D-alanine endopeptidase n=1 Tax=Roseovarius indicus TaxID=540747 RepID=UPI0032ED9864